MADDQTNPFVTMGMMGMMSPNKYLNPMYAGKPLPMPGYYGTPTDAAGNDITSFTDAQTAHDNWTPPAGTTTLNATQQTPPGGRQSLADVTAAAQKAGTGWASVDPNSASGQTWAQERAGTPEAQFNSVNAQMGSPEAPQSGGGYTHDQMGSYNAIGQLNANQYLNGVAQERPAAAAPAAAPTNPIDMRQAYLDALSRPQGSGRMVTPGANVAPSKPLGQPSVVSAFLDQHSGSGPAPAGGGYSNQPFFDTLNKLRTA